MSAACVKCRCSTHASACALQSCVSQRLPPLQSVKLTPATPVRPVHCISCPCSVCRACIAEQNASWCPGQTGGARHGAYALLWAGRGVTQKNGWCCRTPQQLLKTVDLILQTYERSAGSASMLGQAGTLMNPEVITRMKDIQAAIQKDL